MALILYSTALKIRTLYEEAIAAGLDEKEAQAYARAASILS